MKSTSDDEMSRKTVQLIKLMIAFPISIFVEGLVDLSSGLLRFGESIAFEAPDMQVGRPPYHLLYSAPMLDHDNSYVTKS